MQTDAGMAAGNVPLFLETGRRIVLSFSQEPKTPGEDSAGQQGRTVPAVDSTNG